MAIGIGRRELVAAVSCVTLAWPLAARAQQDERIRRIGVLIGLSENDPEGQLRIMAFRRGLQDRGWEEGRNLHIDYRWTGGSAELRGDYATELLKLMPDVLFAGQTTTLLALKQATSTVPIVFVQVDDPVGGGFVASLARPGGNITGFGTFEYGIAEKWVELVRELAPRTTRIGIIYETVNTGIGQLSAIESTLSSGIQSLPFPVRSSSEIEEAIERVASQPDGSLIVLGGPLTAHNRDLIVTQAGKRNLPSVFPYRYFANAGGLVSYGPDTVDQYRVAADYIDRILKGEKPAELPVQFPTKYNLVINLKTAKALGLIIPQSLLATADDVIE
jgi:putative tryptophan/tyrosine transport system substrate-binding protein